MYQLFHAPNFLLNVISARCGQIIANFSSVLVCRDLDDSVLNGQVCIPRPNGGVWVVVVCEKGLLVDDEKHQKARRLLENGSDKVAYDILKQLADGPRRPAELRADLGIASANFFTARYLTPLAKSGYIAVSGGEKNRYLPGKQYRILRKG